MGMMWVGLGRQLSRQAAWGVRLAAVGPSCRTDQISTSYCKQAARVVISSAVAVRGAPAHPWKPASLNAEQNRRKSGSMAPVQRIGPAAPRRRDTSRTNGLAMPETKPTTDERTRKSAMIGPANHSNGPSGSGVERRNALFSRKVEKGKRPAAAKARRGIGSHEHRSWRRRPD
jgi:hypothetical protein